MAFQRTPGKLLRPRVSAPLGDPDDVAAPVRREGGPPARSSCPPAAARLRGEEAPPDEQLRRSAVLGPAAPDLVALERGAADRETGHGGRLAPCGLCALLEVALQASAPRWTATITREVQDLVRRMARENGWRATRIRGELQKLGFDVSERTVSRYLRRGRRRPKNRQSWLPGESRQHRTPSRRALPPSPNDV